MTATTYPNLAHRMGDRHSGFAKYVDGLKLRSRSRYSDLENMSGNLEGVVTIVSNSSSICSSGSSTGSIDIDTMRMVGFYLPLSPIKIWIATSNQQCRIRAADGCQQVGKRKLKILNRCGLQLTFYLWLDLVLLIKEFPLIY
jgi:hypothetical protein